MPHYPLCVSFFPKRLFPYEGDRLLHLASVFELNSAARHILRRLLTGSRCLGNPPDGAILLAFLKALPFSSLPSIPILKQIPMVSRPAPFGGCRHNPAHSAPAFARGLPRVASSRIFSTCHVPFITRHLIVNSSSPYPYRGKGHPDFRKAPIAHDRYAISLW